jgi:hypothetical protein
MAEASLSAAPIPETPVPQGPMTLPSFYLSGGHGVRNPHHPAAAAPYQAFENAVCLLASKYLFFAHAADATETLDRMLAWSRSEALLEYDPDECPQAWFQCEWTIATTAVALGIIRIEPDLSRPALDEVLEWLHRATCKLVTPPNGLRNAQRNNHAYWRGFAALAVGILVSDPTLREY